MIPASRWDYTGALLAGGIVTEADLEPSTAGATGVMAARGQVARALESLGSVSDVSCDPAAFEWVWIAARRWAHAASVRIESGIVHAGVPVRTRPAIVSIPDRAGRVGGSGARTAGWVVRIHHILDARGAITDIQVDAVGPGELVVPEVSRPGGGAQLARAINQLRGVRVVPGSHPAWCVFLQPGDPRDVLERMADQGVIGGDPIGDLSGRPGGIAAIAGADRSAEDRAAYVAALRASIAGT